MFEEEASVSPEQLPTIISFERWIEHVFDHPILDPQWWWRHDSYSEFWNEQSDSALTLSYLTRLFRDSNILADRYSRAQIDQGFNYLVSNSCSNHMFVLTNRELPLADRTSCILAIGDLYRDLFSKVYGNDIAHGSHGGGSEPNYACYMWWDMIPLYGGMDHPDLEAINDAVLTMFEGVLKLRSEACLESVLHGLGHWQMYCPREVDEIVGRFIRSRSDLSDSLRGYAELARVGHVQ